MFFFHVHSMPHLLASMAFPTKLIDWWVTLVCPCISLIHYVSCHIHLYIFFSFCIVCIILFVPDETETGHNIFCSLQECPESLVVVESVLAKLCILLMVDIGMRNLLITPPVLEIVWWCSKLWILAGSIESATIIKMWYLPLWSDSSEDHKNLLSSCAFVDCFYLFWCL